MSKKQTSKQKPASKHQRLSFLLLATAGLLLGIVCMLTPFRASHHHEGRQGVAQTRELLLLAVDGLIVPAPIDAKTGDAHFPQAKLYLPGTPAFPQLTYTYDDSDNVLRVSTRQQYTANASKLYSAHTQNELFSQVPHLQACSRGVILRTTTTQDDSLKPIGTKVLKNGKTLYVYNEKQCSELDELAKQLVNVQSY
jgi:hypothetical protein